MKPIPIVELPNPKIILALLELWKECQSHFTFIRSYISPDGFFYCCNREEKVLPGGEILRFDDYPWHKMDRHLLDEEPPFYRWFFSFRPTSRHLRVASIPVPFGRLFDGPMRQRLTHLSQKLD